ISPSAVESALTASASPAATDLRAAPESSIAIGAGASPEEHRPAPQQARIDFATMPIQDEEMVVEEPVAPGLTKRDTGRDLDAILRRMQAEQSGPGAGQIPS